MAAPTKPRVAMSKQTSWGAWSCPNQALGWDPGKFPFQVVFRGRNGHSYSPVQFSLALWREMSPWNKNEPSLAQMSWHFRAVFCYVYARRSKKKGKPSLQNHFKNAQAVFWLDEHLSYFFHCGKIHITENLYFNHFEVYNSVASSTFIMLLNHHHHLVSELFHHHERKLVPTGNNSLIPTSPSPWHSLIWILFL